MAAHIPRIAELYLMIRRPKRPTFSVIDQDNLLGALGHAREWTLKCSSAEDYGSDTYEKCHAVQKAIDELAWKLTGDPEHFHMKWASYPTSPPKS